VSLPGRMSTMPRNDVNVLTKWPTFTQAALSVADLDLGHIFHPHWRAILAATTTFLMSVVLRRSSRPRTLKLACSPSGTWMLPPTAMLELVTAWTKVVKATL